MKTYNFNTGKRLYRDKIKIVHIKGIIFCSVKQSVWEMEIEEKKFPGDERERNLVKRKKEIWWRIDDLSLVTEIEKINEMDPCEITFYYF